MSDKRIREISVITRDFSYYDLSFSSTQKLNKMTEDLSLSIIGGTTVLLEADNKKLCLESQNILFIGYLQGSKDYSISQEKYLFLLNGFDGIKYHHLDLLCDSLVRSQKIFDQFRSVMDGSIQPANRFIQIEQIFNRISLLNPCFHITEISYNSSPIIDYDKEGVGASI